MAGLLPLMAFSAIVSKEVIHFYVDAHNKVSSHITFYGQKVIIERYYQKPYQSSSNQVSFRTQDRATYQIDCQQQKVALLAFSVVKPRSRAIYKRQYATNWLPASGPEFEVAFRKVCQADLEKPEIMHPDQWLSLRDDALSKKADQRDILVKKPSQQTLATAKRDKKTTESAQSEELLKNSTLKIASLTRDYSSPVLMVGQQETISRIVQDIGFDCEKKRLSSFVQDFITSITCLCINENIG